VAEEQKRKDIHMNSKRALRRNKDFHQLLTGFLDVCYLATLTGCKAEGIGEMQSPVGSVPQKLTKADIVELETYFRTTMKYLDVPGSNPVSRYGELCW